MLIPLYAITLFLASGLLFAVEPLVAKGLLPCLGGGAAVWTTAVAFFQVALVGGYLYAHLLAARVGTRRNVWLHLALLAAILALFPLARPAGWVAPPTHQALWLFSRLAVTVGPPFVLLAATAPLVQSWFASTRHRGARDPYFLYAASNAGSMAALLAYPVAIEPFVGLARQRHLWNAGLILAVVLLGGCALAAVRFARRQGDAPAPAPTASLGARSDRPTWRQRGRWLALAAVPSSLLLSVTTYVTTDLVAVPLLWLVPLALYLGTFIAAFSPRQPFSARRMLWLQPLLLVPLAAEMFESTVGSAPVLIPIHLGIFFVTALCCHQTLAAARPEADRSTEFYLWIAVGGAVGGLFNVFAAPLLFRSVMEYPLGLVAAALLRPAPPALPDEARARRRDLTLPLALAAILAGAVWLLQRKAAGLGDLGSRVALAAILATAGCATYAFRGRPRRFGLGLLAMMVSGALYTQGASEVVFRARSFYAVHRIVRSDDSKLQLVNGNTVHGVQDLAPAARRTPLGYYSRGGPIGDVMRLRAQRPDRTPVGVVGLGVGTLAAYAQPGERWTFFEIDPAIVHIARDGGLFTYLADARAEVNVVLGDGRLSLAQVPDGTFGLLVLDAFSSDAVPAHLLTREALALYVRKLAPGGLLAFHLSNRYLALVGVVAGGAAVEGVVGLARSAEVTAAESAAGISPSIWAVLARDARDLGPLASDPRWRPLSAGAEGWSDDASSLWSAFSLR